MRQSVETLLRPLRLDWTTIRRRIGSGFALKRRAAERAPDFELALKGAIVGAVARRRPIGRAKKDPITRERTEERAPRGGLVERAILPESSWLVFFSFSLFRRRVRALTRFARDELL